MRARSSGATLSFLFFLLLLASCGGGRRPVDGTAPPSVRPDGEDEPRCAEPFRSAEATRTGERPMQTLQGRHVGEVVHVSMSPNRRDLASLGAENMVRVWNGYTRRQLRTIRTDCDLEVGDAVVGGDGAHVFWADDGTLSVWCDDRSEKRYRASDGREMPPIGLEGDVEEPVDTLVRRVPGDERPGWLLFQQDSGGTGVLSVLDDSGRRVARLLASRTEDPDTAIRHFDASADGRVVGAVLQQEIRVWRRQGSGTRYESRAHDTGEFLEALALSESGNVVVAGVAPGLEVFAVSPDRPDEPPKVLVPPTDDDYVLHALAVSDDGALVAAATSSNVIVWSLPAGTVVWHRAWEREPGDLARGDDDRKGFTAVAFEPGGYQLLVGDRRGRITAFHGRSGRLLGDLGAPLRRPREVVFAGPGARVLAVRSDDHVTLWSLEEARVVLHARVPGVRAVTTAGDRSVAVVRVPEEASCPEGRFAIERAIRDAGVSEEGSWVARTVCVSADMPASGHALDPEVVGVARGGGRAWIRLTRAESQIAEAFPGMMGAFPVYQYRLARVDLESGERHLYPEDAGTLAGLSADGSALLTRSAAGGFLGLMGSSPMSLWSGDASPRSIEPTGGAGNRHSLSDDGRFLVEAVQIPGPRGTYDHYGIVLRTLPDGDVREQIDVRGWVSAVAVGREGRPVVVGLTDGRLLVSRDWRRVVEGRSDGGSISGVVVAPDGASAATWSEDGGVRVWDLGTATVRATLVDFDDDEWAALTPGGAYAGTAEVGERIGWVFTDPLEHFGFEQFSAAYSRPEVVRRRLAGGDVDVEGTVGRPPSLVLDGMPPTVVTQPRARVRLRARSERRVDLVRAFVDGRHVDTELVCAGEGSVQIDVPVLAGLNRLTLLAFDDRGFASNPVGFDVEARLPAGRRPDLWVLTVGVSRYPRLLERVADATDEDRVSTGLPAAANDAHALAEVLRAQAGPGKTYATAHVVSLTDEREPVSSRAVLRELAGLGEMQPEDVAVVLLAGHGFRPGEGGDMVFVTSGARLSPDAERLDEDSLRNEAIGWGEMSRALASARGRVLLLVDACHSGHVSQELVVPNDDLANALVRSGRAGTIVFAASKGRQLSLEPGGESSLDPWVARGVRRRLREPNVAARVLAGGERRHGFFTGAFVAALTDPGTDADGDGTIQVSEIVDEVRRRVARASDGLQTPWVARRDLFGDFGLVRLRQ